MPRGFPRRQAVDPNYNGQEMVDMRHSTPEELAEYKLSNMADTMELARQRVRNFDDPDPDIYGYGQELEDNFGIDLLTAGWKAKPGDARWDKRVKARARKAVIAKLFLQGFNVKQIADKVQVSELTVYNDIHFISQEWRKSYLGDTDLLAGRDLERLEYYLTKLMPGIERGDTKAITTALEIVKERAQILGYRQGMQVDIEQMVREVAEANGYDPDKAMQVAQRISITMK